MTLKELLEKRKQLTAQARAIMDEGKDKLSADDQKKVDDLLAEAEGLADQIKRAQRLEAAERFADPRDGDGIPGRDDADGRKRQEEEERTTEEHRRGKPASEEQQVLALQAWMRYQSGKPVEPMHVEACRACNLNLNAAAIDITLPSRAPRSFEEAAHPEKRALSGLDGTSGGFTVGSTFIANLETAMFTYGGILRVAEVIRTERGDPMPWPTADDSSNTGSRIGESTAVATTGADPAFGSVTWGAYTYTSNAVLVPVTLMEDSAFDLATQLSAMLGERIGRKMNTDFTTGTAPGPKGIVTASALGTTTALGTAVTTAEVLALTHSVDPAYRIRAGLMFHDSILLALRQLKDGNGRALVNITETAGIGGTLAVDGGSTYPFTLNNDMASALATSAKTMLFGDLSKYKVRMVRTLRLRRLVERYAEADQEAFVAFARADGNLLAANATTYCPVKHLIGG